MSFGFIFATQKWQVTVLFALFGVFYAIDEAQVTFINDLEKDRLASPKGLYNFVTGLIYLPASVIAGLLWAIHPTCARLASRHPRPLLRLLFSCFCSLGGLHHHSVRV